MKELKIFNYENKELDYGIYNNEPVFNLNTVAEILEIKNLRQNINIEDKDYVIKLTNSNVCFLYNRNLNNRGELFLTEAGLYKIIMRSNKPSAEAFQKWVVKEVLPEIRKTGGYNSFKTPANYIEALELALEQAKKIETLNNKIEEDKPKVAFANAITDSNHCITITELSRYLQANGVNIGRNKLYEYLRKNNYLISGGRDKNLPTQKYMEMGLFRVVESTVNHNDYQLVTNQTLITGKGQEYFLNKLLVNE